MRGRVGMVVLLAGLFAAGVAAATIQANPAAPSSTTLDETTESSTGETTTTFTTTTAATTTTTTTTSTATTKLPAKATVVAPVRRAIRGRCLLVGAFVVLEPDRPARVLGPVAQAPRPRNAGTRSIAYPADGSVVTASSIDLHTRGCGTSGRAEVRALSLFDGAITAQRVELDVRGNDVSVRVRGLVVDGSPVSLLPGRRLAIQQWGYAVAHGSGLNPLEAGALAVHLIERHAGLPAGTVLLVSFAGFPNRPATRVKIPAARRVAKPVKHARPMADKRHRLHSPKRRRGQPLKVTPPLGLSHYVFPVAGHSDYIDTYGAYRGDVPGNWHHGDDIFAALGTPVLAVADGTLNRVGWQRLGGWRLWVRDSRRNEFYYAHLSGYSPLALHSKHVKAGDVIGFIGNTGDAFTTSPHLHFEIHPHSLLRLHYNGAVNPTSYLDEWQHVTGIRTPKPALPPFPAGAVRAEARFVWRQLLAARGLISHAPSASERPRIRIPRPDAAARVAQRRLTALSASSSRRASWLALLSVLVGAAASVCLALQLRRRRERNTSEPS